MALEDFKELYEQALEPSQILAAARDNSSLLFEEGTYKKTLKIAETYLPEDLRGRMEIENTPQSIMKTNQFMASLFGEQVNSYASRNLEAIVGELKREPLERILLSLPPTLIKGYENEAKAHEEYGKRMSILANLKGKDEKKRAMAADIIRSTTAPEMIKKSIEEYQKTLKESQRLSPGMIQKLTDFYVGNGLEPKGLLEQFEKDTKATIEKYTEKKLGSYVTAIAGSLDEKNKQGFYGLLYQAAFGKDKGSEE
jgi:hypothetical protein